MLRCVLLLVALAPFLAHGLTVTTPCCSTFTHVGARFGPTLPLHRPGVFGILSRATSKECDGALPGTIVMIDRGMENFVETVQACQLKQAKGVVVRDVQSSGDDKDQLVEMISQDPHPNVVIPSVFVSRATGEQLDILLATNPTVVVELSGEDDMNLYLLYLSYVLTIRLLAVFLMVGCCMAGIRLKRSMCKRRRDRQALLVSSEESLMQPLNTSQTLAQESEDEESKPVANRNAVLPVVYGDITEQQDTSVPVYVDVKDEVVFEQQEQ